MCVALDLLEVLEPQREQGCEGDEQITMAGSGGSMGFFERAISESVGAFGSLRIQDQSLRSGVIRFARM
jgi:hypothetical protein